MDKIRIGHGLPVDIGLVDIDLKEHMFWLYLPVSLKGMDDYKYPKTLDFMEPIMERVKDDLGDEVFRDNYIYVTVKNMVVAKGSMHNRGGLHTDGFLDGDINYIWTDNHPTEFFYAPMYVPRDHYLSLLVMEDYKDYPEPITYPVKSLLRLDETMIHRSPLIKETTRRAFIKVSVSDKQYNLEGNSINHALNYSWTYHKRSDIRNKPNIETKEQEDRRHGCTNHGGYNMDKDALEAQKWQSGDLLLTENPFEIDVLDSIDEDEDVFYLPTGSGLFWVHPMSEQQNFINITALQRYIEYLENNQGVRR